VLYAFPRITSYKYFTNKVGRLIEFTSFVPVLDINEQVLGSDLSINVEDNNPHKFRTSYDGKTSEINYYYFVYNYNLNRYLDILAELVCVQIQRLASLLRDRKEMSPKFFTTQINKAVFRFLEDHFKNREFNYYEVSKDFFLSTIDNYLNEIVNNNDNVLDVIPSAPSNYSTILPEKGLKINTKTEDAFNFQYQVF
jgi:hypothetical protein